ncbi:retrovirus-related Pol polyprotein from transposon opus [Trichonephila clavipes]|nr:retrovirus-related Pol polyprotein from transposon opus [Trichonephila clavipes]
MYGFPMFSQRESLLKRHENDPFLKRIITGDEKWVVYNNVKRKRSWSKKDEPAETISKADIHQKKSAKREDELKCQEREDELEKLKIEASMISNGFRRERNSQNEGIQEHVPVGLQKLMRTFDPKEGEISFYLILFERQARSVHIKEEDWVTNLVGLLSLEMANLIAREPEEKANDYMNI